MFWNSFVGHHIPKKERQSKVEEMKANFTNVYVKNLDPEVDDLEFQEMFTKYGPITSAVVQRDETGKSKCFGFVNFENHEDARVAVDDLHDSEHRSRKLFVSRAQKKNEREEELKKQYEMAKMEKLSKYQGVNLYIKNLEDDIDDERLRQEFSVYGVITSAKVMRDDKVLFVSQSCNCKNGFWGARPRFKWDLLGGTFFFSFFGHLTIWYHSRPHPKVSVSFASLPPTRLPKRSPKWMVAWSVPNPFMSLSLSVKRFAKASWRPKWHRGHKSVCSKWVYQKPKAVSISCRENGWFPWNFWSRYLIPPIEYFVFSY